MKNIRPVQKTIIIIYLILLVAICIYVPWQAGPLNIPAGYSFIWNAPEYYYLYPDNKSYQGNSNPNSVYNIFLNSNRTSLLVTGVDMKRLLLEFIIITALCGVAYISTTISKSKGDAI